MVATKVIAGAFFVCALADLATGLNCAPCKNTYDEETLAAVPSYIKGTKINCASIRGPKSRDFNECKGRRSAEFGYNGVDALACCNQCPRTVNNGFQTLCDEINKSGDSPLVNCVVDQIRYVTEEANKFSCIRKVVDFSQAVMKSCCISTYGASKCNY